jgi:hypothetical protein
MAPPTGDIWRVDIGAATRRSVDVISDDRFHRLAERAIVAPVLPASEPGRTPPWWITHDDSVIALERLSSTPWIDVSSGTKPPSTRPPGQCSAPSVG